MPRLRRGECEIRVDSDFERVAGTVFGSEEGGEGDHACVVGGECRWGGLNFHTAVLCGNGEGFLQSSVTGNSAGKGD